MDRKSTKEKIKRVTDRGESLKQRSKNTRRNIQCRQSRGTRSSREIDRVEIMQKPTDALKPSTTSSRARYDNLRGLILKLQNPDNRPFFAAKGISKLIKHQKKHVRADIASQSSLHPPSPPSSIGLHLPSSPLLHPQRLSSNHNRAAETNNPPTRPVSKVQREKNNAICDYNTVTLHPCG